MAPSLSLTFIALLLLCITSILTGLPQTNRDKYPLDLGQQKTRYDTVGIELTGHGYNKILHCIESAAADTKGTKHNNRPRSEEHEVGKSDADLHRWGSGVTTGSLQVNYYNNPYLLHQTNEWSRRNGGVISDEREQ